MAADSVGQIGLDLVVNEGSFKKQMTGISGLAKKAAAALAGAFAIKKIADFGAQCLELGSDLAEVQNVVDVTFPQMSKQIDRFAKDAAGQFGLSETMAKKFTGTFGAMAKAFGFSEKSAHDMSTTLTGLAGDVASFYNISQDEAYTKLKSVFTGETETLKDLGIVMTQNALDAYAMANGYGKTTKAMSEAEKVALRYRFVQDQLTLASGDFVRTSDGWANQVRVLKLQFESLKATIGQGLINALTPVIQVINTIIGKLMSLANAFRAFTEMISGKKGSGGGASVAAAGMEAVAKSADNASASMGGAGGAAKKAASDAKKAFGLAGFDELNVVNTSGGSSGSGGIGGGGAGGYQADEFGMGGLDASVEETDRRFQKLMDRFGQLKNLFQAGFSAGFGDMSVLDDIQEHLANIKINLKDIFTDADVQQAAKRFENIVAINLGKIAGSAASVGATVADNLIGVIDRYLRQNSPRIKEHLVSMFDIASEISKITGNFSTAFAQVFAVFRGDAAKELTADIIKIFMDVVTGVNELAGKLSRDVLDVILTPFTQNTDKIAQALENTITPIENILGTLADSVGETFDQLNQMYDEHLAPFFDSIRDGFSDILGTFLDGYNTYLAPVLDQLAEKFSEVWTGGIQPLINYAIAVGNLTDLVKVLWENVLQPLLQWFAANVFPVIAPVIEELGKVFLDVFGEISKQSDEFLKALNEVVKFLTNVFFKDWNKAWEDARKTFSNAINSLPGIATGVVNKVISAVEKMINGVIDGMNGLIDKANAVASKVPGFSGDTFGHLQGITLPRVQALAQGGFVEANTPRLAMIGDNRHYGEIVAPENKLQEMIDRAVMAGMSLTGMGSGGIDEDDLYRAFKRALDEADMVAVMDSDRAFKNMQKKASEYRKRSGKPAFGY